MARTVSAKIHVSSARDEFPSDDAMLRSMLVPRTSMLDLHDDWNLVAIGALNLAQLSWWCGLLPGGSSTVFALFAADAAYLVADTCWVRSSGIEPLQLARTQYSPCTPACHHLVPVWHRFASQLVFVPTCVPAQNRRGLLMHHLVACGCLPVAAGKPVLMAHLLRTWVVELQSWTHIAARRLQPPAAALAQRVNRPLFFAFRIVAFPITWVLYARSRAALPATLLAAHVPLSVHVPLSLLHFAMYGLMLNWGRGLLLRRS